MNFLFSIDAVVLTVAEDRKEKVQSPVHGQAAQLPEKVTIQRKAAVVHHVLLVLVAEVAQDPGKNFA